MGGRGGGSVSLFDEKVDGGGVEGVVIINNRGGTNKKLDPSGGTEKI